jgi:outer membrane protein OmpA-like peptidoglycan-associated protein
MRILITGLILFVIWSFFSMWLYVDILKPITVKPVVEVQPLSEKQTREADSLKKFFDSMPKALMIYFDFDKALFKADPLTDNSISEMKKWMEMYPGYKLHITGYTDFIGTQEYNLALGMKRAEIVKSYVEKLGIGSDKLVVSSRGKEEPVDDQITSAGRAKNRRTELTLKK